jgi:two-component system NtrC family sensor kinase
MYSSDRSEINRVVDRNAEACYQCHDAEEPLTKLATSERTRVFETDHGYRTLAAIDVIYNEPSCWTAACHAHPQSQNLLGVVDVGVRLDQADQRVARTTREAIIFGIVSTLVICGLAGLFIHRFVHRPVKRLLECTRRVAQGDLNCSIQATSDDEIGHLARSFIGMTEDLRKARTELSSWAHKLEDEVEIKTRDLRLAQAQIVRSEKLSSIGLLAAGVAHELNSPLTGILTFAHLLAKKIPDRSQESEDLDVIVKQTERCATIIRQLLDFSREGSPERKSQDVHVVLEQAIALVERQALFHNIEIQRDLAPDLPKILMDAGQMQQVFLNLLVNAGEAMPACGRLTIQTRGPATAVDSPADDKPDRNEVRIVIRDTGVGIPAESIGKVFDPFFTSKDVGQGTGLGLAVSYGIIERHGGMISVESTPGEGTTFTIRLPAGGSNIESA